MICSHVSSTCAIGVILFVWSQRIGLTLNRLLFRLFVSWLFVSCLACWPDTDLCHVSSTCVIDFVSLAFKVCWLALNRSLFRFHCIWHCLLIRHWFAQCQQHLNIGVILQYNYGSVVVDFEQVTVSIRFLFTWVLCIYIILDKGCHILYVFSLDSTVCSHMLGVHLSSDQVTYEFMMDADLHNSFLLFLFNFTCIILYLILLFLFTCSICIILFNTYVQLCFKNFLEQTYRSNSYSTFVYAYLCLLLRYVCTKWMTPNKYCGIFFVHWSGQVH